MTKIRAASLEGESNADRRVDDDKAERNLLLFHGNSQESVFAESPNVPKLEPAAPASRAASSFQPISGENATVRELL